MESKLNKVFSGFPSGKSPSERDCGPISFQSTIFRRVTRKRADDLCFTEQLPANRQQIRSLGRVDMNLLPVHGGGASRTSRSDRKMLIFAQQIFCLVLASRMAFFGLPAAYLGDTRNRSGEQPQRASGMPVYLM